MRTHQHTNGTRTAIGYVRVSTQEQAAGGRLDAQRDGLRACCKLHSIRLIDSKADADDSRSRFGLSALQRSTCAATRVVAAALVRAKTKR